MSTVPAPSQGVNHSVFVTQFFPDVPYLQVLTIEDEQRLKKWLEFSGADYTRWGNGTDRSKPFARLAHEVLVEGSVALALRVFGGRGFLVRYERTLSMRIDYYIDAPTLRNLDRVVKLTLVEFICQPDGTLRPRRHKYPSEKFVWGESDVARVAVRLCAEELGIELPEHYFGDGIASPYLRIPQPEEYALDELEAKLEVVDDMHRSESYPGLWTCNHLERRVLVLPKQYFRPEGYEEAGTRNVCRWVLPNGDLFNN